MTIATSSSDKEREKRRFSRLIDIISIKYSNKIKKSIKKAILKASKVYYEQGHLTLGLMDYHRRELRAIAFQMYSNSIDLASERQFQSIKHVFNLNMEKKDAATNFHQLAFDFIMQNGMKLAKQVTETTEKNVLGAILRSQQEGLSVDETVSVIRDRGDTLSRSRAITIAVTETHNALSWAKHESTRQISDELNLGLRKEWAAVEDDRTRPSHASADGQRVDMDDNFIVGGEEMKYPGDTNASAANTINCRCTETYVENKKPKRSV
jgi:SPP1 gp7 family putative phage head morphogenesis protein